MRPLVLQMQITVDGFVAGPNGELDWIFESFDDAANAWIVEHAWRAGLHIMGSRSFQDMASYWPSSPEPVAAAMNEIPKAVFSRSGRGRAAPTQGLVDGLRNRAEQGTGGKAVDPAALKSWAEPYVASGDLEQEIARLKGQSGKEILAHGGAGFARSLVRTGLVDEYRLLVHPVALDRGLPLFADLPQPLGLTLVSSTPFPGGIVPQVYHVSSAAR